MGRGKEGARRGGGRRSVGLPGRAAMNLERLRKRVRQYLDQVGGPTGAGTREANRLRALVRRGDCGLGLGGAWSGRAWAFALG